MSCEISFLALCILAVVCHSLPFPPIPPCLESSFSQDLFLPSTVESP